MNEGLEADCKDSDAATIAAWNTRPEEDRLRSEIEVLKARVVELENLCGISISRGAERLAELREKHGVKS